MTKLHLLKRLGLTAFIGAAMALTACGGDAGSPTQETPTPTDPATGTTAQTITFAQPADMVVPATATLAPTSTSGLTVTLASTTTAVCTVSGFTVTAVAAGTCSLTASQAGDTVYAAATSVTRTLAVTGGTTPPATDNLISNGDFSNGSTGWSGVAANVRPGESFNFADVTTAGNPWDVTLQYVLNIPASDVKYKLRFKAWSDRSRTINAGIGLNQDPWTNVQQTVNLTAVEQTFELSLTSNFASATSRVFFEMGAAVGQVLIDDVELVLDTTVTPPAPTGAITFSSGFTSTVLTASGGKIDAGGGSNLDGWNCNGEPAWCGKDAGGAGADSFMYHYYQTPSAAEGLYSQIEVFGPNVNGFNVSGDTGGVTINGQTKVNFTFNPNAEWFNSANNKFAVVITLGKLYGTDCRLQLHGVKAPTSAGSTAYSMVLSTEFRVAADCGQGIAQENVAAALAASPTISSVKFLGAGGGAAITGRNSVTSGANMSVAAGAVFPTTVALKGAITFD